MNKNILIVLCTLYFLGSDLKAQTKKPSDARKDRLELQTANKVFDESDQYFKIKDVPEKWKDESAVVLAQKTKYEYSADGRILNFTETKRKRIKLHDKAAVEEFSKFYFYKSDNNFKIGIRIIKADGTVKNVSTSDAVDVTNNIPGFFRSSIYGFRVQYRKIAISDLETGDIIDFFQEVHGSGANYTGAAQTLEPIFFTLDDAYPIVKQRFDFIAERGYFINFKSMNGAPDLTKNTSPDHRTFSFTLEDNDRARIKDVRWLYGLRSVPSIKFQVCYAKIGTECEQFLGKVGEPVKSVSPEEIAKKVNYRYFELVGTVGYLLDEVQAFMKKKHRDVKDPMEYLKISYYYLRHRILLNYSSAGDFESSNSEAKSDYFAVVLRELLKSQKIDSKIVVSSPRINSSIDDIVMYFELRWALLVNNKYIFAVNSNSCIYESDDNIESCDGYAIDVNRRDQLMKYEKITIPGSTFTDNTLTANYDVQLEDNMENLKASSNVVEKGLLKASNDYVLYKTDYLLDDFDIYGDDKPEEESTKNKTKISERERKESGRLADQKKDKLKQMKEAITDDFANIISYDDFELVQPGRSSDKSELKFKEKFTLGDMVKKAGPNYAVDVSSLIGTQVDIKSDEKKRDYDVYLNYPKTLDYTITMKIPSGYKVEGLDGLKFNVTNNTGSFVSDAKVEGDKITITAKKIYKTSLIKKEDWSKMVDFLDAGFNFSKKKIILKKA